MRDKAFFFLQRLTMRSLCGKVINNIHYLSYFYYCHIFPNIRHGIIITFVVPKICCLSHPNSWRNLLDTSRKIQVVKRMKVDSYKVICPDFGRNIFDVFRDYHDYMPLVDLSVNLLPCQLQELPCLSLVLIILEFIIRLI